MSDAINVLAQIKPLLTRLNAINSRGSKDEEEHQEYLRLEKQVKELLKPEGYTINWNHAWQEFGVAVSEETKQ